jgi:hypothetical protein
MKIQDFQAPQMKKSFLRKKNGYEVIFESTIY